MSTKIKQMPVDERIRLVEDLWDRIATDQSALPLTLDQKTELDQRLDAYEATGEPGRPFEIVMAEIRDKVC